MIRIEQNGKVRYFRTTWKDLIKMAEEWPNIHEILSISHNPEEAASGVVEYLDSHHINADLTGKILPKFSINRSYEVPYLAGYSQDGKTIYIDRRFPTKTTFRNGKTVDITRFIVVHESTEKALMDHLGMPYQQAHHLAIQAERKAVEDAGLHWGEYNAYCMKYVHATGSYKDIPPDIDMKPDLDAKDDKMVSKLNKLKGSGGSSDGQKPNN